MNHLARSCWIALAVTAGCGNDPAMPVTNHAPHVGRLIVPLQDEMRMLGPVTLDHDNINLFFERDGSIINIERGTYANPYEENGFMAEYVEHGSKLHKIDGVEVPVVVKRWWQKESDDRSFYGAIVFVWGGIQYSMACRAETPAQRESTLTYLESIRVDLAR